MLKLKPCLKNYEWGKYRTQSLAAKFDQDCTYEKVAEAWWGSHLSGPAFFENTTSHNIKALIPLQDVPYLLKTISVDRPLSLQVHPNSQNAVVLHTQQPHIYPDAHPKPEVAIAITQFRALCGFLPDETIRNNLAEFPEFAFLAGGIDTDPFTAIKNVLSTPPSVAEEFVNTLIHRIPKDSLIYELYKHYPHDIGVFAPLFMNYVVLEPGQSLVIPPQELHCYLSGDAVECMAPSDNVIRAGLTPKFCDVKTLFQLVEKGHRTPIILDTNVIVHPVLQDYFQLHLLVGGDSFVRTTSRPSIGVVVQGEGKINGYATQIGDSWLLEDTDYFIEGNTIVFLVAQ